MKTPMDVKGAVAVALAEYRPLGAISLSPGSVGCVAGRTAATAPQVGLGHLCLAYLLGDGDEAPSSRGRGRKRDGIRPRRQYLGGLAFLEAGARSYAALDRFPGARSTARWHAIGIVLLRRWDWPRRQPDLPWPADLDPETWLRIPTMVPTACGIIRRGVEKWVDGRSALRSIVGPHVVAHACGRRTPRTRCVRRHEAQSKGRLQVIEL